MKKSFFVLLAIFSAVVSYAQPQDRRTMDWAAFNRYAAANAEVTESPLVVFMGDSITDNWAQMRPGFFSSHNYIGRGISGQTVEHMLARFQQDVIDLHPRAVAIMAGVNNIAGNNGKIDFEDVVACIKSMCEIAKANNIVPILCSLTPCHRFFWNPGVEPAEDVIRLNSMYEAYAREAGIEYVDYHKAMALPGGVISEEDSNDGCHPTVAGYEKMEALIVPVIERVLAAASRPARQAGPARQMGPQDWPNFKRYEEKNASLTEAPLMVMEDSLSALRLAATMKGRSNRMLESDIYVAALSLSSGIRSANLNVDANLPAIEKADPEIASSMRLRVARILAETDTIISGLLS